MSEPKQKFYLTTPIYYVNARPHIGHAYTTIAADVIARRHRLLGDDTFFLTGTDEHGQKIQRSAEAAGIAPQQFADEVSDSFRNLWKRMGITNDDYIRTTEPRHKAGVQKLFRTLQENGYIELRSYTGQYCISDETFVDVPVGAPCPECGRITETVTEENYFFKLSAFQRQLIDLIESGELAIQPETRRNEVLSFLRGNVNDGATENSAAGHPYVPGALKDLSISRTSFKWGIPVPGDEKHVIYVWLDALANYMTAIGYGSDDPAEQAKFEKYWPADLHLVGKEIIRFHCVYWPAFLLAAKLPLPKAITAHGWLLFENDKMSKSKGNIVRTETILDAFGTLQPEASKHEQDLFAADVLRYFLLREIPFGNDGSFSFDAVVQRYNSDLANGYGNLVSRTLKMIADFRSNSISERSSPDSLVRLFESVTANDSLPSLFEQRDFSRYLDIVWGLIAATDNQISSKTPWKLAKNHDDESQKQLDEVLYAAAESIRIITALLYPILPYATSKVWAQLGLGDIEQAARNGKLNNLQWGDLKPGTKLGALGPIFPRAPKELIQVMNDIETANATKSNGSNGSKSVIALPQVNSDLDASARHRTEFAEMPIASASATAALNKVAESVHPISAHHPAEAARPETPQIGIDDFVKVDLRVAQIVVAERIPKADKLLRLEVDLGYERRQILSGIAQWYTPEELIGRRIVVIANLAPRKMRGLESHGMLLAASEGEDGKPVLATFGEEIALGSRLK
ncbi:methionine--tRNA ligase [Edaphobacter acidisoli]|uniref:Methionine--tRNA ligase n=1 Tax=Edaphobacter acidisoli TaxID=2040573 RepID=A0A916RG20_9BACT|nr:methionine--tRNA ligase [Edaphobacter acidisoli]GGA54673.1 methionine--tRNA ligase [Edaphobacter acidisoli]